MNYYKLESQNLVLIDENIENSTEYIVKNNLIDNINMIFSKKGYIPIFMNYRDSFESALNLLEKYFGMDKICFQEARKNVIFYETDSKVYDLKGNCIEHHCEFCDENIFLVKVICFYADGKIKETIEYENDENGETKIMKVFDDENNLIHYDDFSLYD